MSFTTMCNKDKHYHVSTLDSMLKQVVLDYNEKMK